LGHGVELEKTTPEEINYSEGSLGFLDIVSK